MAICQHGQVPGLVQTLAVLDTLRKTGPLRWLNAYTIDIQSYNNSIQI